ncbi:hypothetical protein ACLOJK_040725 [Asimina triloba]
MFVLRESGHRHHEDLPCRRSLLAVLRHSPVLFHPIRMEFVARRPPLMLPSARSVVDSLPGSDRGNAVVGSVTVEGGDAASLPCHAAQKLLPADLHHRAAAPPQSVARRSARHRTATSLPWRWVSKPISAVSPVAPVAVACHHRG